ncbi:MAG: hypothetical protein HY735_15615 [Verrucomicrobia bacterium]|nr:hypothetical protein [Verrucomicrobiota bacterium]
MTELRVLFDQRGAGRNTRGRVCSPILIAYLRLRSLCLVFVALALLAAGCGGQPVAPATVANNPHLATNGTVEVTAKLLEIPEGAIFKRDLYDYATILKYEVVTVHRGAAQKGATLFVGHYNPWKPRSEAPDRRVKVIGGNLRRFQTGQLHHLALEAPIEDHFMGGIVNKYFGQTTNAIYWAVWTNLE